METGVRDRLRWIRLPYRIAMAIAPGQVQMLGCILWTLSPFKATDADARLVIQRRGDMFANRRDRVFKARRCCMTISAHALEEQTFFAEQVARRVLLQSLPGLAGSA